MILSSLVHQHFTRLSPSKAAAFLLLKSTKLLCGPVLTTHKQIECKLLQSVNCGSLSLIGRPLFCGESEVDQLGKIFE